MPERRNFTRPSGFRDSSLIVIAAEGEATEKIYFDGLKEHYQNKRVLVKVIDRLESGSDPARVLMTMDRFRATYNLKKARDQLWLVIDVDRWGDEKLSIVSQLCQQKEYRLAVSNPAFEIWLLLHIRALDEYSPEILAELSRNRKTGTRTRLEIELKTLLGSYNKASPEIGFFCEQVFTAIKNARTIDTHPEHRWPLETGTRVYLLVEEIVPPDLLKRHLS